MSACAASCGREAEPHGLYCCDACARADPGAPRAHDCAGFAVALTHCPVLPAGDLIARVSVLLETTYQPWSEEAMQLVGASRAHTGDGRGPPDVALTVIAELLRLFAETKEAAAPSCAY